METDDPKKPEFASLYSYNEFASSVSNFRRFVLDEQGLAFLKTVIATNRDRDKILKERTILYRAQLEVDWQDTHDDDGNWVGCEVWGCSESRMRPRPDRATEGRANPTGIPVFYAATTPKTAISEVRPWVGSEVSVAKCKLRRPIKVIDLSLLHGTPPPIGAMLRAAEGRQEPTALEKERSVWIDIDNAFSQPVTASDDRSAYAPTQILSELFRSEGYDAIRYKSNFGGDDGYNVAVFDLEALEIISCAPFTVDEIDISFRQSGNPWVRTVAK